jgi:hypothetical protein
MIDWVNLCFNALWVLGAAVILAALSFFYYEAQRRGERLRARLAAPGFQAWLSVGLALISLSLALIGPRWWERVLWGLLCAMSAWQLWIAWREWKAERAAALLANASRPARVDEEKEAEHAWSGPELGLSEPAYKTEPLTKPAVFTPLGLALAVLLFYVVTLAPTVLWGDDAYFQRTAFENTLRADGGGHWLWLQAAQLFIRLPWGDVAYRVNLLSAAAAAGAVVVVYAAARALGLTLIGATGAAVSLAVSHTFWTHAVRAEVYSLFMLVMALQLWLWLSWRPKRTWPILAAALLFGTTLLGHQLALLLLPALGFLLWQRSKWLSVGQWVLLVLLFTIGLWPFFAVIRDQMGDVNLATTLRLYFTHSGDDYRHALFDFSLRSLPRDAAMWVGLLGLQFVGLAGLLGLWGGVDAWRKDRSVPWFALFILYATGVLFAFSYHVNDQYVFYLPSYLVFALFVGRGWQAASETWPWVNRRVSTVLILALLVAAPMAVYNGSARLLAALDANPLNVRALPGREPNRFFLWPAKNGYRGAADYGHDALETLPPDSVFLADYTPMETILYFRSVEGLRPDIRLKYVAPGKDLTLLVAQFPPESVIYLAGNDPDYYNISSLPGAALEQEGVIYRLVLER